MKDIERYDIYGVVFSTVCQMTAEERSDLWFVCSTISLTIEQYLKGMVGLKLTNHNIEIPKSIFDTKNTDDIPSDIKAKKTIKTKEIEIQPADIEPTPDLLEFNPIWIEKPIDLTHNSIIRYSNPCTTLHGKCGKKCVQTEIWLKNNQTGNLTTVDCEFEKLDDLKSQLDPRIKYSKSVDIQNTTKKLRCSRKRLEQLAALFNRGCTNAQVAQMQNISINSVSAYRSDARRYGLLNESE